MNNQKERIKCNACNHNTWHQLEVRYTDIRYLDMDEYDEYWDVLRCLGCDAVTVRLAEVCEDSEQYTYYPERTEKLHKERRFQKLPAHLARLYTDVVITFNNDALLLCAAGIRALIEGICYDKGITKGPNSQGKTVKNLEGKINGLTTIVPERIVRNLHGLRFLGNKALHQFDVPTKSSLELALSVVEDILNVVYDLDYKSILLSKITTAKLPVALTPQEIQVLELTVLGHTVLEISSEVGIGVAEAAKLRRLMYEKVGVKNKQELVDSMK